MVHCDTGVKAGLSRNAALTWALTYFDSAGRCWGPSKKGSRAVQSSLPLQAVTQPQKHRCQYRCAGGKAGGIGVEHISQEC